MCTRPTDLAAVRSPAEPWLLPCSRPASPLCSAFALFKLLAPDTGKRLEKTGWPWQARSGTSCSLGRVPCSPLCCQRISPARAVGRQQFQEGGYAWSWMFQGKTEPDTSVPTGCHRSDYFLFKRLVRVCAFQFGLSLGWIQLWPTMIFFKC